ncbi:hypothetical protein D3C72_1883070 [compost metagenome]
MLGKRRRNEPATILVEPERRVHVEVRSGEKRAGCIEGDTDFRVVSAQATKDRREEVSWLKGGNAEEMNPFGFL